MTAPQLDGQPDFKETLEANHLEIVKCLDLDRQYILSHLRSKFVLDDEDCQIIRAGTTRQQQVFFLPLFGITRMTLWNKCLSSVLQGLQIISTYLLWAS